MSSTCGSCSPPRASRRSRRRCAGSTPARGSRSTTSPSSQSTTWGSGSTWSRMGPRDCAAGSGSSPSRRRPWTALDQALVAATQAGLPLVPEPYAQLAAGLGWDPGTVTDRLAQLLAGGAIRRIGAVPNHYRLGLRGNGMTVWDIEDAEVDRLGAEVGALETVSHCYRRPRRLPLWPYNLFAMVHGRDRTQVLERHPPHRVPGGPPLPGPPGALQRGGAEEDRPALRPLKESSHVPTESLPPAPRQPRAPRPGGGLAPGGAQRPRGDLEPDPALQPHLPPLLLHLGGQGTSTGSLAPPR